VVITADVRRKKVIGIEVHIEGKGHSESHTAAAHVRTATERGYRVRKFDGDGAYDTHEMFAVLHGTGTERREIEKVPRRMPSREIHRYMPWWHRARI
jgi:hypothetical protein